MDLVGYQQAIFNSIQQDYLKFAEQLPTDLTIEFVPISALDGDNVVSPSVSMPWYQGKTLLSLLEDAPVKLGSETQSLRFPVQYVNRPDLDFRGYSGTISSGALYQGQQIKVLPSGQRTTIKRIVTFDGDLTQAKAGQAITLVLANEIDISRGDIIVDDNDTTANISTHALIDVVWMSEQPLVQGHILDIKIAGKKSRAKIENIHYQVNVNKLTQQVTESLGLNAIGSVDVSFDEPLVLDNYQMNADTGGLIFIDRLSNVTVGAGLIRETQDAPVQTTTQYNTFEVELNQLIRRHFPHWGARDLLGGK